MAQLIFPILLFGGMYMLLIRPQQQKMKAQQALVNRAAAGDRVMLASGVYGTLTEVLETSAYLEVAEGIEILINRVHIQEILTEFPTGKADEADDDDYEEELENAPIQDDVNES